MYAAHGAADEADGRHPSGGGPGAHRRGATGNLPEAARAGRSRRKEAVSYDGRRLLQGHGGSLAGLRRVTAGGAVALRDREFGPVWGLRARGPLAGRVAVAAGFTSFAFEKTRDRNLKWKNRKHRVPLHEGRLWVQG